MEIETAESNFPRATTASNNEEGKNEDEETSVAPTLWRYRNIPIIPRYGDETDSLQEPVDNIPSSNTSDENLNLTVNTHDVMGNLSSQELIRRISPSKSQTSITKQQLSDSCDSSVPKLFLEKVTIEDPSERFHGEESQICNIPDKPLPASETTKQSSEVRLVTTESSHDAIPLKAADKSSMDLTKIDPIQRETKVAVDDGLGEYPLPRQPVPGTSTGKDDFISFDLKKETRMLCPGRSIKMQDVVAEPQEMAWSQQNMVERPKVQRPRVQRPRVQRQEVQRLKLQRPRLQSPREQPPGLQPPGVQLPKKQQSRVKRAMNPSPLHGRVHMGRVSRRNVCLRRYPRHPPPHTKPEISPTFKKDPDAEHLHEGVPMGRVSRRNVCLRRYPRHPPPHTKPEIPPTPKRDPDAEHLHQGVRMGRVSRRNVCLRRYPRHPPPHTKPEIPPTFKKDPDAEHQHQGVRMGRVSRRNVCLRRYPRQPPPHAKPDIPPTPKRDPDAEPPPRHKRRSKQKKLGIDEEEPGGRRPRRKRKSEGENPSKERSKKVKEEVRKSEPGVFKPFFDPNGEHSPFVAKARRKA